MRLNSIKLAGFKSFVDPTHLAFQSNLTAVVGPNGCGKSNIVDAIHCVLGSTSRHLRAEQMADVIFNGTHTRKPVGQASIELIFDNTEGRLAGEYAKYPEISIRRELNRDGQSNYYLNGTRCRRKDITDIFLGTGLGNNSYAIIEQGMISRLIEAKPEELRAHVEEAAGTSKYKERRRETENRIKHTRENLERLNDVREEQAKQLMHLQRQANAAEKYKILKAEQRLIRAQLQAILWQGLNQNIVIDNQKIFDQETLLESEIARLRSIDKEIEYKRSSRTEQNDLMNEIQSQYYSLGAEINRVEQNIAHTKDRKKQLERDSEQLESSYQELQQQHFEDQHQLQEVTSSISHIEASFLEAKEILSEQGEILKVAEENMHAWQEKWDELNNTFANSSKQAEVEKTRITHLEQKQEALVKRITRIKEEQAIQNSEQQIQEVNDLQQQQKLCQAQLDAHEEQLESIQQNIQIQRIKCQEAQQDVNKITKEFRDLQAQHASMQALQQIALGKENSQIKTWLTENALGEHQRLAEGLDVESGWELAVEMVLADHLDAICITDFSHLAAAIGRLQNAEVTLFNLQAKTPSSSNHKDLPLLQDKIHSKWPVGNLLHKVYTAQDLTEALSNIDNLEHDESIVTRDGIWLSATWLRFSKIASEKTGVLQREHQIKELQHHITEQQTLLTKQELIQQQAQEQLTTFTEEREILQQQLQSIKAQNSEFIAQTKTKQAYIQQLAQKQHTLQQELAENEHQLEEVIQSLEESRINLASISTQAEGEEQQRKLLLIKRDDYRSHLEQVRQQVNSYRQKADEHQVRLESRRSQLHYLNQNLARAERQLSVLDERRQMLLESLNTISDPLPELNIELQQTLEKRAIVEEQLATAKGELEALESNLQTLERSRQQIDISCQDIRNGLEQLRLDCQSLKVKVMTHAEQITAAGFTLDDLLVSLAEEATATIWEEKLAKLDTRIQRLGPINLAAIDEYAALSERKEYLDKQHDDLVEALTTLENAIRKIDKETRVRFKETFIQLNNSFKAYFNQIFGGGEAYLELTSEDLLETGVIVKAQPPGKRNSTIHLLSGGEKALTAIALVFAIFSLNPAPFCVLDEVDAPLDDANVVRFCNLVRNMAEKIQFIFISHNKIAIEMGQQLAGVTMHEPGVSRLVSVDVEQAISMAST